MKILKFWYVACAVFCIYSLNTLVNERYEVESRVKNQNETEPIVLACKEFNSFHLNESVYELNQLKVDLYHLFNTSNDYNRWRTWLYMNRFKELILNPIETGSYRIFNSMLCFTAKDRANDPFTLNLFLSNPKFFSFKNCTADFLKMEFGEKFDQLIVLKKGYPYSKCSKSNSRFRCLNECFKKRFRLSRYFYNGNETGLIYLNSSANQSTEKS